jgi:hypothetical protein
MRGELKEKWMALCEQAANEQDPEKLMALVARLIVSWRKSNSVSENKSPAWTQRIESRSSLKLV